MRLIVLSTSTSDPLGESDADCGCALLEAAPELVELVRRRAQIAEAAYREDSDLYELHFWKGDEVEFYEAALSEAVGQHEPQFETQLTARGYAILPDGIAVECFAAQQTECNQMILRISPLPGEQMEVAWVACPKHTGVWITTAALPLAELERLTAGR